ncbi:hypothetical protein BU26DRAFT_241805 [Trematosphaeria pertusa]|uniref:Uncharacterized protein n=1 Tax=Trematosphaeria pertusa TaxID=390896 RepID=A0A6A6IQ30_9PLEO|nr:uncharacterized protein BU26DRAFT_241805 [Trematosphaeria pertusa]KAF2251700.1 hypothetical protein BU26DRAFT_241805 [Trematosphaeria pertusa]
MRARQTNADADAAEAPVLLRNQQTAATGNMHHGLQKAVCCVCTSDRCFLRPKFLYHSSPTFSYSPPFGVSAQFGRYEKMPRVCACRLRWWN